MRHLVELFYSDHCLSCPDARGLLRRFAGARADVIVLERNIDSDTCLEMAKSYHLIATPAVVIDRTKVLYGVPRLETLAARVEASAPALD